MRFILSSPAASESIKRVAARSLAAAPAAADLEPILELVTEHRYPEAEAKLKEEIARQGDSSLATDYAALLGRIEDEEAIQGMRQLYLAGKWHELFDAASRYLDDTGSGKVRYREEAAEYKADASRHFGDGAGLSERAASTSPQAQKPARNGP